MVWGCLVWHYFWGVIVFGCCKFVPEFGFGSLYVCGVWFARKSLVFYAWGGWLLCGLGFG